MSGARFSIIPAWVVKDSRLKGRDLQVLCLLGSHTNGEGWCRRSQVKMAAELGCGRATIQDALGRLYEIGAVEKREVESADGRDSAHYYRVVHDRRVSQEEIERLALAENEEFDPNERVDVAAPPAGIPAGGAGSGAAPPAGSGPAPINDTSLTIVSNERERASAKGKGEEENPDAVRRAFKRWYPTWPTYVDDSEPKALKIWMELSPEDREAAVARSADYVAAVKEGGRKYVCSAQVYLSERRWEKLSAVALQSSTPSRAAPFGKAWMAKRLSVLLAPMASLPRMTATNEKLAKDGGDLGRRIEREHRERYGWPVVSDMHARAARFEGVSVSGDLVHLGAGFEQVRVGSDLWASWKALHEERGWPWLPDTGRHEWVYFPEGGPEGFSKFEAAVKGVRGHDAA